MLVESTGTAPARGPADALSVSLLRSDGRLEPGGETVYPQIARLLADAYPVMEINDAAAMTGFIERLTARAHDDETVWAVARRQAEIVGAMRLYDFVMNLRGSEVMAGGLGSVAVSLLHKRQGVARAMIAWYIERYRARGAAFAVLHPFRPDFYRGLGFGYGTPMHRYSVTPATLRAEGAAGTVRALGGADADAVFACSERVRSHTNGLLRRRVDVLGRVLADVAVRWIGVEENGTLRAFMQTSVVLGAEGTANANALMVRDFSAEDERYAAALFGYLRAQQDQFARIVFETQDDAFYLNADDPRAGGDVVVAPPATHRVAETGLGIMYRVLDCERALAALGPSAVSCTLRIDLADPFFPPTAGARTFAFGPGHAPRPAADASPDVTLRLGIADFSSLVAGSLRLDDLLRHRLASVDPPAARERVGELLDAPQRPHCMTRF